ncbi:(R)-mandelonitrile lyase [Streptomyces sp. NPDC055681]
MEFLEKKPTTKGAAERFTGDVWVDMSVAGEAPSRFRVGVVRFAPCARTAWHRHTLGQTLCVTEGVGLVQARGGRIQAMRPGDTAHTPPGEWHWHGAAPAHFMTHRALSESSGDPAVPDVEWGERVTNSEYEGTVSEA